MQAAYDVLLNVYMYIVPFVLSLLPIYICIVFAYSTLSMSFRVPLLYPFTRELAYMYIYICVWARVYVCSSAYVCVYVWVHGTRSTSRISKHLHHRDTRGSPSRCRVYFPASNVRAHGQLTRGKSDYKRILQKRPVDMQLPIPVLLSFSVFPFLFYLSIKNKFANPCQLFTP